MNIEKLLLYQPVEEVRVAMQEEGCLRCFGCPEATALAATISSHADWLLRFVQDNGPIRDKIDKNYTQVIDNIRIELKDTTEQCGGFKQTKSPNSLRPAKMCNSPRVSYSLIELILGKIGEQFS
jgi:hypothetical protein